MKKFYWTYANRSDNPLPHLEDEYKEVKAILNEKNLNFDQDPFYERATIVKNLISYRDHLEFFGYSGHAGGKYLITEEDRTNVTGIAGFLKSCPKLKVVLLNGCGTKDQVKVMQEADVAVVIYTYSSVDDELAKIFAVTFFRSLVEGENLRQAFDDGKNAVKASDKAKQICFRTRRGLDLDEMEDNEWGIYTRQDKYLDCSLDNWVTSHSVFDDPAHQHAFKLFFLGDKSLKDSIYSSIKHLYRQEIASGSVIWRDIWDIHDNLSEEAVVTEIKAADAVLLCVNGAPFFDNVWDKAPKVVEIIKNQQKVVLYLHARHNMRDRGTIFNELDACHFIDLLENIPIPDMIQSIKDTLSKQLLENTIKQEIDNAIQSVKKDSISEDILQSELMEFDLSKPLEAFRKTLRKKGHFHLFCIEGTPNCGQDFLLNRLKQDLLSTYSIDFAKSPIVFNSNQQTINELSTLWSVLANEMKIPTFRGMDKVPASLVDKLLEKPTFLVFDHVITAEMTPKQVEHNVAILKHFWQELCQHLPPASEAQRKEERIFVFAVNRGYDDDQRKFSLDHSFVQHPLVIAEILPTIEQIDADFIPNWYLDKKNKFKSPDFEQLNTESAAITGDGYLGDVLMRLCTTVGCMETHGKLTQW